MENFKENTSRPVSPGLVGNSQYIFAQDTLESWENDYLKSPDALKLRGSTKESNTLFDKQFEFFKQECLDAIGEKILQANEANKKIEDSAFPNILKAIYDEQLLIFTNKIKELQASLNLEKNSVENVEGEGISITSLNNLGLKISKTINANLKADAYNTTEGLGMYIGYMGYKRSNLSESQIAKFKKLEEDNASAQPSNTSSTTLPGNLVFKITFKNPQVEARIKGEDTQKEETTTNTAASNEDTSDKKEEGGENNNSSSTKTLSTTGEGKTESLQKSREALKLAESYLHEIEELQEGIFSDAKDKIVNKAKELAGKVGDKLTNLSKDKTQADTSKELNKDLTKEKLMAKCGEIQASTLGSLQTIKKINSGEGQNLRTFLVSFSKGKEPYWSDKAKAVVFTIEIVGSQKQQGKVMNFLTKMANIATNV